MTPAEIYGNSQLWRSFYQKKFIKKTKKYLKTESKAYTKRNLMQNPKICRSPLPSHFLNDAQENRKPVKNAFYICLSNSHTAAKTAAVLPCDDPKFQWVL